MNGNYTQYEPKITQQNRAVRRKDMSREIEKYPLDKRSEAVRKVAKKLEVSIPTVLTACREHNVMVPRRSTATMPSPKTLQIIGEIANGKTTAELTKKYGLTRQRISVIRQMGQKAKLLPKM